MKELYVVVAIIVLVVAFPIFMWLFDDGEEDPSGRVDVIGIAFCLSFLNAFFWPAMLPALAFTALVNWLYPWRGDRK